MIDYASMTDDQLNRLVAERLGYTVETVNEAAGELPCFGQDRGWLWVFMRRGNGDCEPLGEWASSIAVAFPLMLKGWVIRCFETEWLLCPYASPCQLAKNENMLARMITVSWLTHMDAVSADSPKDTK